jgi:(E)-4-hydroxy-3-methylbut-2-enyl-diphosphate synthase
MMKPGYCKDFLKYKRRNSTIVTIGDIPMGGNYPVRIQSMTNTDTSNIAESVKQIIAIANEGADYVRLTVPGQKDAESLQPIKSVLAKLGQKIPLIADIHFNPRLAHIAATIVEKVRINPGNFTDKKPGGKSVISDKNIDFQRLRKELLKLIEICRKHHTVLRIGTNHGSLSDRIMDKYGDTAEGMVESAMEFLRICKEVGFNDVVVSMKASNTRIMVYASRLLAKTMEEEDMVFPIHLGVTEAGEGEDGRIKSAVGIGALLADGIGETIRVSLTEDPEIEIPVARKLADYFSERLNHPPIPGFGSYPLNPYEYNRRKTLPVFNIGGNHVPVVISSFQGKLSNSLLEQIGWTCLSDNTWKFNDTSPDYLLIDQWPADIKCPPDKKLISRVVSQDISSFAGDNFVLMDYKTFARCEFKQDLNLLVTIKASELNRAEIASLKKHKNLVAILETDNLNGFADQRAAIIRMINQDCLIPVILKRTYSENVAEDFQLKAAADFGGLFIDGLGDGIWIENRGTLSSKEIIATSFGILQASRVRTTKTEYISCPSCGRTLFDLQLTTRNIRERTNHLKSLKIGIMGCIVNGPGEMADADYGYVGAGRGKVTLYKQKEVIKRNVSEELAVEELINIIKENGDWVEP